ncbi:MAG TPA: hypothetical protein VJX67_17875 [Blastocatellia bacterium]|nr:hypothetical protein [Blastocatellia bacterium]
MLRQWPRIALILVPSLIVTVDASVLLQRWREPDAEKAVRIVRASSSHIESFTIQQYLNSTIFHARDAAEDLGGAYGGVTRIEGWRASQFPGNHAPVRVRFSYSAGGVEHIAEWLVDVHTGVVKAASAAARDLSWND